MIDQCPTCGSPVRVVSGDEGTSHYEPLDGGVEAAYAAGFWAGAQALRDADVILPEDWQRDAHDAAGGQ
jgi:hypothetical protein